MTAELFDLEARLRDDLPRLAGELLDERLESAGLCTPTETDTTRPRGHPRVRALAITSLAAIVAIGAGVLVAMVRNDASPERVSSRIAAGLGDPIALPQPPLSARSSPVLAWTGRSLITWGGYQGGAVAPFALRDGAQYALDGAWEPITENEWGHPGGIGVWTGDRLVVLAKNGGAEYDAYGDMTWRDLPELPPENTGGFVAVAASDGIVYGLVRSGTDPGDGLAIARLDQAHDAWRIAAVTPSGASASSFDLITRPGGLDLWADGVRVARYDIDRDAWEDSDALAVPEGFETPRVVGVGGSVAVVDAGGVRRPVVFDPSEEQWIDLPGGDITIGAGSTAVYSGERLVIWGGEGNPGIWAWDAPVG